MADRFYLDTSVAVHVVVGTAPAATWFDERIARGDLLVSSRLLEVEVSRFLRRVGLPPGTADFLFDSVGFLSVDDALLREAAAIVPVLKTLDCLHLATAGRVGWTALTLVTHDAAMARAAQELGCTTTDPLGAD